MSSNSSSSVIDTASITYTFVDIPSITCLTWSTIFSARKNKEFLFELGIHPVPQPSPRDCHIYLWHNKVEDQLDLEYEVSILNDRQELCYTKYYQCNYNKKFDNNRHISNFILYEELIRETNCFTRNYALTLHCEVKIMKSGARAVEHSKCTNLLPKLCTDFESIFTTGDYSDLVLAFSNKEFKVHKAIMTARSSVFKAMLSADLEEKKQNRVEITDVDSDVFEQLLAYIYSGNVAKLDEYALELFIAADKYELAELKSICALSLASSLTVDTVAHILLRADMHSAPELKSKCIKFVTANSAKVMRTDAWKQMVQVVRCELMAELYEDIANADSACERYLCNHSSS